MTVLAQAVLAGLFLVCLILVNLPARAGNASDPGKQRRELDQQNRVHQGAGSGHLLPREFTCLENQEPRIMEAEAQIKVDGHLRRWERAPLNCRLNLDSRALPRLQHLNRKVT